MSRHRARVAWRPSHPSNVRPAVQSLSSRPRRERYTLDDLATEWQRGWDQGQQDAWGAFDGADAFQLGYDKGRLDERWEQRERAEMLRQLAESMVADLERWLSGQGGE